MKSKFTLLAIATIVSVSTVGVAHAHDHAAVINANASIEVGTQAAINNNVSVQASTSATVEGNTTSSAIVNAKASTSATIKGNATSSAMKNENASGSSTRGNATSTSARNEHTSSTASVNGKLTAETHRSVVATFVQSLLAVADREGGIGTEVRAVAQSQNDSASTTVSAMTKVDGRGSFHIFLAGSDYKNLGVIRSEIATTTANIAKLKALLSQATSDTDRAELNVQIKALEDEQVKIEAYLKANEGKFSLFGWLNRMFVK